MKEHIFEFLVQKYILKIPIEKIIRKPWNWIEIISNRLNMTRVSQLLHIKWIYDTVICVRRYHLIKFYIKKRRYYKIVSTRLLSNKFLNMELIIKMNKKYIFNEYTFLNDTCLTVFLSVVFGEKLIFFTDFVTRNLSHQICIFGSEFRIKVDENVNI